MSRSKWIHTWTLHQTLYNVPKVCIEVTHGRNLREVNITVCLANKQRKKKQLVSSIATLLCPCFKYCKITLMMFQVLQHCPCVRYCNITLSMFQVLQHYSFCVWGTATLLWSCLRSIRHVVQSAIDHSALCGWDGQYNLHFSIGLAPILVWVNLKANVTF